MTSLKNFKNLNYKRWALVSTPIIFVMTFVTIVTASPAKISEDIIQTAPVVSPVALNKPTDPQTTPISNPPVPATKTIVPSTTAKPNQAQPINSSTSTQPSRSKSTSTSASPPSTKASSIIATGKRYIGVPYIFGGTTPAGFDCSGFVQYVFAKNGIRLPRVSRDQFNIGTFISYNNLKPGDIVFFSLAGNGVVDHEGIYVGNNQFINAASSKGVTIYTLGPYWQSFYVGAKRVL